MISIQIIGNLTREPVQREVGQNKVTEFTVAANRRKVKGEVKTNFYKVSAWGALGETCFTYLAKGKKVYVHGEHQYRSYENAEGKTVTSEEIVADTVEFLSGKADADPAEEPKQRPKRKEPEVDFTDVQSDDIPF